MSPKWPTMNGKISAHQDDRKEILLIDATYDADASTAAFNRGHIVVKEQLILDVPVQVLLEIIPTAWTSSGEHRYTIDVVSIKARVKPGNLELEANESAILNQIIESPRVIKQNSKVDLNRFTGMDVS